MATMVGFFLQDHHRGPKGQNNRKKTKIPDGGGGSEGGKRGRFWPGAEGGQAWLWKHQVERKLLKLCSCFSPITSLRHNVSSQTCYNSDLCSRSPQALKAGRHRSPILRNWTNEVGNNFGHSLPDLFPSKLLRLVNYNLYYSYNLRSPYTQGKLQGN